MSADPLPPVAGFTVTAKNRAGDPARERYVCDRCDPANQGWATYDPSLASGHAAQAHTAETLRPGIEAEIAAWRRVVESAVIQDATVLLEEVHARNSGTFALAREAEAYQEGINDAARVLLRVLSDRALDK